METFKRTLNELIPQLNNEINELHESSKNPLFLSGEANMYEVLR
jgi:hypothetical protein